MFTCYSWRIETECFFWSKRSSPRSRSPWLYLFPFVLLPSHVFSLLLTCSRTCGVCVFLKTLFHLLAAFERKGDGQVTAALAILHSPSSLFFLSTQAGPWLVWPVSFSSSFLLYLFSIFLQMYEKQVVSWSFMYNDMAFLIVLLQISARKVCKGNINCMLISSRLQVNLGL